MVLNFYFFTNLVVKKTMKEGKDMLCLNCNNEIVNRNKYCSNKCQKEYEYKNYILRWKKRRRKRDERRISNINALKDIFI